MFDGLIIIISNSFARGAFGKVCRGFLDRDVCAVKIWHFTEDDEDVREGKTTAIIPLEQIKREIANTIAIRGVLDSPWPNPAESWKELLESVNKWRLGFIPFRAFGAIACTTSHKAYFAMTCELTDMYQLHYLLQDPTHKLDAGLARVRKATLRSAAIQLYIELAMIQNIAGKVHNDISLPNIFINECLQFKLYDFGKATDLGTTIDLEHAPLGSLIAPELVAHERFAKKRVEVTGKEDIFDLAAALFQFAEPPNDESVNPFAFPLQASATSGESKGMLLRKTFAEFDDWKSRLLRPGYTRLVSADVAQDTAKFGQFFAPLASSDPDLCDILLNDAMETQPTLRKDAVQVACGLHQAIGAEGADRLALEALRDFLRSLEINEQLNEMAHEARQFSAAFAGSQNQTPAVCEAH